MGKNILIFKSKLNACQASHLVRSRRLAGRTGKAFRTCQSWPRERSACWEVGMAWARHDDLYRCEGGNRIFIRHSPTPQTRMRILADPRMPGANVHPGNFLIALLFSLSVNLLYEGFCDLL